MILIQYRQKYIIVYVLCAKSKLIIDLLPGCLEMNVLYTLKENGGGMCIFSAIGKYSFQVAKNVSKTLLTLCVSGLQ